MSRVCAEWQEVTGPTVQGRAGIHKTAHGAPGEVPLCLWMKCLYRYAFVKAAPEGCGAP